ncbi:Hypothetical protein EIN_087370, partial [Entamoeba invadens IP1]
MSELRGDIVEKTRAQRRYDRDVLRTSRRISVLDQNRKSYRIAE